MNSDVLDTIEAALIDYCHMLADYEKPPIDAALAEVRRLREAGPQWEPLPQGQYEDVYIGSKTLALRQPQEIVGSQVAVFLPDDIRLCRRTQAGEV